MPKRAVQLEAFDFEGESILRQVYPKGEWYEKTHAIIDSDAERARLRIARIRGEQYDHNGTLEVTWDLSYAENGALREERVWRQDGSTEHNHFPGRG